MDYLLEMKRLDSGGIPKPCLQIRRRYPSQQPWHTEEFLQGSYLYRDGAAYISTGKEFAQTTFAVLTVISFGAELFGWNETPRPKE